MSIEGNKFAEKLPTMELKQKAYDSYCAHIAKGYPQKTWYFEEGEIQLTWETMENYFKRYPELCEPTGVFDPIKKKIARCKNYTGWFELAQQSADGTNQKANTATLQMIMRNLHEWDKKEDTKNVNEPSDIRDAIRFEQQVQLEVNRRLASSVHEGATSFGIMETEQPLLDQGSGRSEDTLSDELGAKGTL